MRVLLVEDDPEFVDVFELELTRPLFDLNVALSRSSALVALEESYELVICDLNIPSDDHGLDTDVAHGMAVLSEVVNTYPGTPIIAFSAYGSVPVLKELLRQGRHGDYLGVGEQQEMVTFLEKSQLTDCLARVKQIQIAMADLADIELSTGMHSIDLGADDERTIRIFARRTGGTLVRVTPLGGGLSGSRVLSLRVESSSGHKATVVAKIDEIRKVREERRLVETYVAGALPPGVGGLFFQAAGYDDSLLDVVSRDAHKSARAVATIEAHLARWRDGARIDRATVGSIRELLAPNDKLLPIQEAAVKSDAEAVRVHARTCIQHCDLHVFNVLVSDAGDPIVIDFFNLMPAPAALDAVTLELSMLLHEAARDRSGTWPTLEEAQLWADVDRYVERCPYPEFVTACRTWAVHAAAGDGEICACAYAYCLRQLRFPGCPQELARALIAGLAARLLDGAAVTG
jgi:CheY-like chemotaxis protein